MEQMQPRPEYPRPQMVREGWINLNGQWEFEIDWGDSGRERGWQENGPFSQTITVPFCPESSLSGVNCKDFMAAVWYRRRVSLSREQTEGRVLLHFGAVDYRCQVWVNGGEAGCHRGGYASFTLDITELAREGENTLVVYAGDDVRSGLQPRGKQSSQYHSHGCDYTRTTGIWQTVWLEFVPRTYVKSYQVTGDPENARVSLSLQLGGCKEEVAVSASAVLEGEVAGKAAARCVNGFVTLDIPLSRVSLWDVGKPNLYSLELELRREGKLLDAVRGYFGLRTLEWNGKALKINGRPVFQRLILDQGFYPDGIYTAPSDEALQRDIDLSMDLGFNGARLHEKVFEERFLYWADHKGYLVWGEQANWGLDITTAQGLEQFLPEWLEVVERDYNHPAIVGWCPFNETWDNARGTRQDDEVLRTVYKVTKALDPTRPVIDTSGNYHVETDVFDIHDYEQEPEAFRAKFAPMAQGGEAFNTFPERQAYGGQPYFVSEYGGTWWNPNPAEGDNWGYGNRPADEEEVCRRICGLTAALLENPAISALCYTQLTDVEQEQNGLYSYNREKKFSPGVYDRIRATLKAKAAVEEE